MSTTRRSFLARSATGLAATSLAYGKQHAIAAKNDRPAVGLIGAGWQPDTKRRGRGQAIGQQATAFGDVVTICELDSVAADFANEHISDGKATLVKDYRTVIEDPKIDAVLIATPDHWHAKIAVEAMRNGKDLYCEKPVSVTIQEGQWLRKLPRKPDASSKSAPNNAVNTTNVS